MKEKWELTTYIDRPKDFVIRHISNNCMGYTPTYLYTVEYRELRSHPYFHEKQPNNRNCIGCKKPIPIYLVIQRDMLNG